MADGISVPETTGHYSSIGINTEPQIDDVSTTVTVPEASQAAESVADFGVVPQQEEQDQQEQQPLHPPFGVYGRRRRRRRLWGGDYGASRVPFIPDRASMHYATMLVRICELFDKRSVGEIIHKLSNIRCHDGSPFLSSKWLEDPDGTFFGIFTSLEKYDMINLRDGFIVYELLKTMKKPFASHYIAKFHSMMNMPQATDVIPDVNATDRFVFSTKLQLSDLPAATFEEVFRIRLALCRVFGFDQHSFQFRGWMPTTFNKEIDLYWQAPYAYYDHVLFMLSREALALIRDSIMSTGMFTEVFRAQKLSGRDVFLLVRSLHKTGTVGTLPTVAEDPSTVLTSVVEFLGTGSSYLVWKRVDSVDPYGLPSCDPEYLTKLCGYLQSRSYRPEHDDDVEVVRVDIEPKTQLGDKDFIPYHYSLSCINEMRVIFTKLVEAKGENSEGPDYQLRCTYVDKDGQPMYVTGTSDVPQPYIPEWSHIESCQDTPVDQKSSSSVSLEEDEDFYDALSTFPDNRQLSHDQPSGSQITDEDSGEPTDSQAKRTKFNPSDET